MTHEPHACVNGHDRKPGEVLHRIDTPDGYRFVCTGCWTIGGLLDRLLPVRRLRHLQPHPPASQGASMTGRRLKPCATCGHGKTLHRVDYCLHHTTKRGQTFMGISSYVVSCQCSGYQPTPTRQQATRKDH